MFFSNGISGTSPNFLYKYVMGPTASGLAMSATALPNGPGSTFKITNFSASTSGSAVGGTTTVYLMFKG